MFYILPPEKSSHGSNSYLQFFQVKFFPFSFTEAKPTKECILTQDMLYL